MTMQPNNNDKQELHLLSGESSAADTVRSIEAMAKQQGGYAWKEPDGRLVAVVPDRIERRLRRILESNSCRSNMGALITARQIDWNIIVPALRRLIPSHYPKADRTILLDCLLVTYAFHMGVVIPYMAIG
jgi:hypothetical protein